MTPKIGFIFPGYSSQYVGMAKDLYDNYRSVQELFEQASACLNINFVRMAFASSDAELSKAVNSYPALFLVSNAIYNVLLEHNIYPHAIAGFQIGHYSALGATKSISIADGLYFLSKYAHFYQEFLDKNPIKTLRVTKLDYTKLESLCSQVHTDTDSAYIAARICDYEHIVTGTLPAIEELAPLIRQAHGRSYDFRNHFGIHSPLASSIRETVRPYLVKIDVNTPKNTLYSPFAGTLDTAAQALESTIDLIYRQVSINDVIDQFKDADVLVQIGPGTMIADLAKSRYPEKPVYAINTLQDIAQLQADLELYKSERHSSKQHKGSTHEPHVAI